MSDYYININPWAVYVKEGLFFEMQGGLVEEWGKYWIKVQACCTEGARNQGYKIREESTSDTTNK